MIRTLPSLVIIMSVLVVSACAEPVQKPIGMPNPASAHCVKVGGLLQIKETPNGQVGICVLPDGSQVEEWELFRRDNQSSPKT